MKMDACLPGPPPNSRRLIVHVCSLSAQVIKTKLRTSIYYYHPKSFSTKNVKQGQTMSNDVKTRSNKVKQECQTRSNNVERCQTRSNKVKQGKTMSNNVKHGIFSWYHPSQTHDSQTHDEGETVREMGVFRPRTSCKQSTFPFNNILCKRSTFPLKNILAKQSTVPLKNISTLKQSTPYGSLLGRWAGAVRSR